MHERSFKTEIIVVVVCPLAKNGDILIADEHHDGPLCYFNRNKKAFDSTVGTILLLQWVSILTTHLDPPPSFVNIPESFSIYSDFQSLAMFLLQFVTHKRKIYYITCFSYTSNVNSNANEIHSLEHQQKQTSCMIFEFD